MSVEPLRGNGKTFLADVAHEVASARSKFPGTDHMYVALAEEVGEVARALLENADNLRAECVQVAAMAMRLAEEGDGDFTAVAAGPNVVREEGKP